MWVVMIGNPADGFYIVGPFDSQQNAIAYIESEFDSRNMWAMEIQEPTKDDDQTAPSEEDKERARLFEKYGDERLR